MYVAPFKPNGDLNTLNTNTQNPVIEDRSEIRLKMAYAYVVEYFPELPPHSRLIMADCIVKALFSEKKSGE